MTTKRTIRSSAPLIFIILPTIVCCSGTAVISSSIRNWKDYAKQAAIRRRSKSEQQQQQQHQNPRQTIRRLQQEGETDGTNGPTPTFVPTVVETWAPTITPFPTITPMPSNSINNRCYPCGSNGTAITTQPDTLVPWRGIYATCRELTSTLLTDEFYNDCEELTTIVATHCNCQQVAPNSTTTSPTGAPTTAILEAIINETVAPTPTPPLYPICHICPSGQGLLNPNTTVNRNNNNSLLMLDGIVFPTMNNNNNNTEVTCRDI